MGTELFLGAFCGFSAIGAFCYHRRRKKSPVKVNCWFCNRDSLVHYGNKNCWDCPYCDQYNGFDQDGGYNKPIPSQHDESLNHSAAAILPAKGPKALLQESNGLCQKCNQNQQMKIAQLSRFIPKNQDQEDLELDAYIHQLDCEYRLCNRCLMVLRQTLSRQDAVLKPNLLSWQMSQKRKCSTLQERRDGKPNVSRFISILQLMSLCSALALCLGSLCQPEVRKLHWLMDGYLVHRSNWVVTVTEKWGTMVSAVGFCCIVMAILSAGKHVLRVMDAADCFVWLLVFLVHATPVDDQVTKSGLQNKALRLVVSTVCVIVTIGCVAIKRPPNRNRRTWNGFGSSSPSSSYLFNSSLNTDCSSLSARSFSMSPSPISELPSHYDLVQDNEVTTSSPPPLVPLVDALFLDSGIKAMKIGTPQKSPLTGGVFGAIPRPILPLQLDLTGVGKRRRPLVSPSRFRHKTITQSSWVAGGLWSRHAGHRGNPFYLPGVSVSCPVSRAESEAGDDRFSVLSEPTRTCTSQDHWNTLKRDHCVLEDTVAPRCKSDRSDVVGAKDELVTDKAEKKEAVIGSRKWCKWSWVFYILTGLSLAFNMHLISCMFDKS